MQPPFYAFFNFAVCFATTLVGLRIQASPLRDYESLAKQVAQESKEKQLCGRYSSDSLLQLNFKSKNKVIVDVSGFKRERTYFIHKNHAHVQLDKDLIRLAINGSKLTATNGFVKGARFKGHGGTCRPYELNDRELQSLVHQLCYLDGVKLQAARQLPYAQKHYLACCEKGDSLSCNKYGFLAEIVKRDLNTANTYYEKACEMGYGGGCNNLATKAYRKGDKTEALKRYKEACEKGYREACPKADPEMIDLLS